MSGTSDVPDVSVVIPTRDRCGRLGRSLASVLGQETVRLEVVVVDDGSTDGTAAWLSLVSSSQVRMVRFPSSRGLPQARNAGIRAARGRWVAFLDDDDLWSPQKLRVQLDALSNRQASWAYGSALLVEDDMSPYAVDPAPDPHGLLDQLLVEHVIPAGSSNVIVAAEALQELGGFDETLPNLADWDLWLRLAAKYPAAACSDVLTACVQHPGNMHAHQNVRRFFRELASFVAKHDGLRASRGLMFDDRPFAHWVAEGRARAGHRGSAAAVHLRDGLRHRDLTSARRAARSLLGARPLFGPGNRPAAPEWLAAYGRPSTPASGG